MNLYSKVKHRQCTESYRFDTMLNNINTHITYKQLINAKNNRNEGQQGTFFKMNILGTFCNKLSPKHTSQFSDAETIRLKMVLKEMVWI